MYVSSGCRWRMQTKNEKNKLKLILNVPKTSNSPNTKDKLSHAINLNLVMLGINMKIVVRVCNNESSNYNI